MRTKNASMELCSVSWQSIYMRNCDSRNDFQNRENHDYTLCWQALDMWLYLNIYASAKISEIVNDGTRVYLSLSTFWCQAAVEIDWKNKI